jgi:hypothetical protein
MSVVNCLVRADHAFFAATAEDRNGTRASSYKNKTLKVRRVPSAYHHHLVSYVEFMIKGVIKEY